jgi:hypothetical protein
MERHGPDGQIGDRLPDTPEAGLVAECFLGPGRFMTGMMG